MFPDERAATDWFEGIVWPDGERDCPRCGSLNTHEAKHPEMPYRCRDCRKYFSVKTGTVMADSPIPLVKWVYAIYLDVTNLKGVSSMKLHRDLGVTQKTAWFMQQRIREAFAAFIPAMLKGDVEADETYMGGIEKNKHASKKACLGRGTVGRVAVVGVRDRDSGMVSAKVITSADAKTLQGFVAGVASPGATIYTDGNTAYDGLPNRQAVHHSVGQYVDGKAHTNGIESFWSILKRAHKGTFHRLSAKHLQRYVVEFCGWHNIRDLDTGLQMVFVGWGMVGRRLTYEKLVDGPRAYAT